MVNNSEKTTCFLKQISVNPAIGIIFLIGRLCNFFDFSLTLGSLGDKSFNRVRALTNFYVCRNLSFWL
jgi:hypothetical protein